MTSLAPLILLSLSVTVGVWARPSDEIPVRPFVGNARPIIGMLMQPSVSEFADEFTRLTYVQFIEMGGARVVPVRLKQPQEYYDKIFNKINGLVIPGGQTNASSGIFYEAAKTMYELAIKANDEGDYFPIWGVCLGLDVLANLRASEWPMTLTDSHNLSLPLTFTEGYRNSRTFADMPEEYIHWLETEPITQNNHDYSLLIRDFYASPELRDFYNVVATGHGRDNLEFVAYMEAYNYPFYVSQWHPEKPAFLWAVEDNIDHGPHIIKVAQYISDFFVGEAMKSTHHFDSVEEEVNSMIANAKHVMIPNKRFLVYYYFNFTDPVMANYKIEEY